MPMRKKQPNDRRDFWRTLGEKREVVNRPRSFRRAHAQHTQNVLTRFSTTKIVHPNKEIHFNKFDLNPHRLKKRDQWITKLYWKSNGRIEIFGKKM